MTASHFLITGCARSGTGYIATLLSALGIPCGHERVFCPSRLDGKKELTWPDELVGESSWLAAPFAAGLPGDIPVFHQVREPVSFVRSKVRTRFFELPSWYKSFAEQVCPKLLEGTPLERSLRYWVEWNRMVEDLGRTGDRTVQRHRIEDVDTGQIQAMLDVLEIERGPDRIGNALQRLPRDYNTRGARTEDQLAWSDLPAGALLDEVREMATEYGYGAETEAGTLALARERAR